MAAMGVQGPIGERESDPGALLHSNVAERFAPVHVDRIGESGLTDRSLCAYNAMSCTSMARPLHCEKRYEAEETGHEGKGIGSPGAAI